MVPLMRRHMSTSVGTALVMTLLTAALHAQGTTSPSGRPWMPAPDILTPGALLAVASGNPAEPGRSVIQIYMPDGYRMPPHLHPTDEHVKVLSGAVLIGIGKKFDAKKTMKLVAGDSGTAPTGAPHYTIASGPTILEVSFEGPYTVTYLNANEAPRSPVFPYRP
jgi:quercetin dioxygenase-like cupin family protein